MRIGIPKETFREEKRVALAPAGVGTLVKSGHSVFIQTGAGVDSHFTNEQYAQAGANIVYAAEEVYQRSEMIVKIAPLNEMESDLLEENRQYFHFFISRSARKISSKNFFKKKSQVLRMN